jgi:inhibitor of KinA sporulation pathway (predicted exonuclease)
MFLIIDFEATCWTDGINHNDNEIIEIGAVMVQDFKKIGEFGSFVKPVRNPILSDFCTRLTSITQVDVDKAANFVEVLFSLAIFVKQFKMLYPNDDVVFCSWVIMINISLRKIATIIK